jgi:type I restriction enzyme S subunit
MTSQSKPRLTPKLRFPEFRNAEGWEETELGKLSKILRGGSPRPIDSYFTRDVDGLNWLKIGDVDKEAKYVTRTEERVRQEALNKTRVVSPGDLILSNSMSFGRPYILQIKTCIHDGWIAITDISTRIERDYLYYLISAPSSQIFFLANAAGSGVQNLNADIIKSLPICFPKPAEQQKLASCLSALDELIGAEGKKLEALKTHRKALVQQLIPIEGKGLPHLRFPEFRNSKAWSKRKISEVLQKISIPVNVENENTYREIGIRSHGKGIFHKDPVSGATIGDKRVFRIIEHALIFNIIFAWEQAIATTSKEEAGMIASHRFPMYIPKSVECDVRYIKYVFLTPQGKRLLGIASPGGAGRNRTLGQDEFEKIEIFLPDIEEQTKIADTILAADDHVTSQAARLDALITHKNGLMQQLFPSPIETEA